MIFKEHHSGAPMNREPLWSNKYIERFDTDRKLRRHHEMVSSAQSVILPMRAPPQKFNFMEGNYAKRFREDERHTEIVRNNLVLLHTLAKIQREPIISVRARRHRSASPKMDLMHRKEEFRKKEAKKITTENIAMMRRLYEAKPVYDIREMVRLSNSRANELRRQSGAKTAGFISSTLRKMLRSRSQESRCHTAASSTASSIGSPSHAHHDSLSTTGGAEQKASTDLLERAVSVRDSLQAEKRAQQEKQQQQQPPQTARSPHHPRGHDQHDAEGRKGPLGAANNDGRTAVSNPPTSRTHHSHGREAGPYSAREAHSKARDGHSGDKMGSPISFNVAKSPPRHQTPVHSGREHLTPTHTPPRGGAARKGSSSGRTQDLLYHGNITISYGSEEVVCSLAVRAWQPFDGTLELRLTDGEEGKDGNGGPETYGTNISLDDAEAISLVVRQSENEEEVLRLHTNLLKIFHDADSSHKGKLKYNEFVKIMQRLDLGISGHELRMIIAEADENDDGVIDYREFVPVAIELIQSFKARQEARKQVLARNHQVDLEAFERLRASDLHAGIQATVQMLEDVDRGYTGSVPRQDFRKIISDPRLGLSRAEVRGVLQLMPVQDKTGAMINYMRFKEVCTEVRFQSLRQQVTASHVSDVERFLAEQCKLAEKRRMGREDERDEDVAFEGLITVREMTAILINSRHLILTRVQVACILSEAEVVDGMLDYWKFVPVAARIMQNMFSPDQLEQRAVLLRESNLSPQSLLHGKDAEEVDHHLWRLFKLHDVDNSGYLDQKEFIACLQSLELGLTLSEIEALNATADLNCDGNVDYQEFVKFAYDHLLAMGRARYLKSLQKAAENKTKDEEEGDEGPIGASRAENESIKRTSDANKMARILQNLFNVADVARKGYLTAAEFRAVLESLDLGITPFQMMMIMAEADSNGDSIIQYNEFVPVCVELLQAFRAKTEIERSWAELERKAERAVFDAADVHKRNLEQIIARAMDLFSEKDLEGTQSLPRSVYIKCLKHPSVGLPRSEVNMLVELAKGNKLDAAIAAATRSLPNSPHPPTSPNPTNNNAFSFSSPSPSSLLGGSGANTSIAAGGEGGEVRGGGAGGGGGGGREEPMVSYNAFPAQMEAVRQASLKRTFMNQMEPSALEAHLLKLFRDEELKDLLTTSVKVHGSSSVSDDYNFTNMLHVDRIRKVLEGAKHLNLNRLQMLSIMSLADVDSGDKGMMNYRKFATSAAKMINKLFDVNEQRIRSDVIKKTVQTRQVVMQISKEDFERRLTENLCQFDPTTTGLVTFPVFLMCLQSIEHLQLTTSDYAAIAVIVPHDAEGCVFWREFLQTAYDDIQHLLQEKNIYHTLQRIKQSRTSASAIIPWLTRHQLVKYAENLVRNAQFSVVGTKLVVRPKKSHERHRESATMAPGEGYTETLGNSSPKASKSIFHMSIEDKLKPTMLYCGVRDIQVIRNAPDKYDVKQQTIKPEIHRRLVQVLQRHLGQGKDMEVYVSDALTTMDVPTRTLDLTQEKGQVQVPAELKMPSIAVADEDRAQVFAEAVAARVVLVVEHSGRERVVIL